MSVYLIKVEKGHKVARSITSEEEYKRLRNSSYQLANLRLARSGNSEAKRRLIQFNYSGYYPNGLVKGNKLPSQAFGFDVDEPEEFNRIAQLLLGMRDKDHSHKEEKKTEEKAEGKKTEGKKEEEKAEGKKSLAEELGLLMMERSARQGGHCVFLREKGKTILENQIRIARHLDCEIDTNTHDINRVYFSTSASQDDLLYLSPRLFEDQYGISPGADEQSVAEEAKALEDRERMGQEELPPGAHSANKHFKLGAKSEDSGVKSEKLGAKSEDSGAKSEKSGDRKEEIGIRKKELGAKPAGAGSKEEDRKGLQKSVKSPQAASSSSEESVKSVKSVGETEHGESYLGIPYSEIIRKWWAMYNGGCTPVKSNRDVLTFELAVNLRHICGFDRNLLDRVIPCYDSFPETQKIKCIDSALGERRTSMPKRLRDVLTSLRKDYASGLAQLPQGAESASDIVDAIDNAEQQDALYYANRLMKAARPLGINDSLEAAEPRLTMPVLTAICPAIGMLASGVKIDIHGKPNSLNLIAYIAGDFASGKGSIDPIISAWLHEVSQQDGIYLQQEAVWREKKKQAKNSKNQPEEPKLPVRFLTLNNTVANLADRLANTAGLHAFSFTPEADTVALKWKQSISDFSVMLRQAYDASRYDREAKSADAVSVHIEHLRWNVTMCGTPDALYRVVTNYTDGFQSRIAIARTPDNTYSPLEDNPRSLSSKQEENIHKVAHLLPLMQGTICLPKLEERGRLWLETIRLEAIKNDDTVMARQRFRTCVTAQRMIACMMLCQVCDKLIKEYGLAEAERMLRQKPDCWQEYMLKAQTPSLLNAYNLIADALIDGALFYFRSRIEKAMFKNGDRGGDRTRTGKNDSIFERLAIDFNTEQAYQQAIQIKGNDVSRNSVKQMLKNWQKQGLIANVSLGNYKKLTFQAVS